MIYLDSCATTREYVGVADAVRDAALMTYGNPSSVHAAGDEASRLISSAKTTVMTSLGVPSRSHAALLFTSGGTEADNLAIFGVMRSKPRFAHGKMIISAAEHPAVAAAAAELERTGVTVRRIPVTGGVIDREMFFSELDADTVLVSFMLVNNEFGAVFDIAGLFSEAKRRFPGVITHSDAVQGYMKLPFSVSSLSADMVSLSAHKIGGPKGVGALYVSGDLLRSRSFVPHIYGGGQESGFRSGTENVPGIAGFAEAVRESSDDLNYDSRMTELRERLISGLPDNVHVNQPSGKFMPHIISLTLPMIKSEVMVRYMSAEGICISSGSACSSHSGHISPALLAFGLGTRDADCTVRVSLDRDTDAEQIDVFSRILRKGTGDLARVY